MCILLSKNIRCNKGGKMRKFKLVVGLLVMFSFFSNAVYAQQMTNRFGMTESAEKMKRGCKNILFSFLEVPNQIYKSGKTEGTGAAASTGLIKGLLMTPVRFTSGVLDVFTCFDETDWEDEMSLS